MSNAEEPWHAYEIRVAGTLGEGLLHAFADMHVMHLGPAALLRLEVPQESWDAADIVAVLCARGHSVSSVRKCHSSRRARTRSPLRSRNDAGPTSSDLSDPGPGEGKVPDQGP
jgi:hypothetical protein